MKNVFKIFIIVFLILSVPLISFGNQFNYNLSTYYSSRLGSVDRIFLRPQETSLSEPCNEGTLYFGPGGVLTVCQDDGFGFMSWGSTALWQNTDNNVYLDDPSGALSFDQLSVGIGTVSPEFKLTLEGDGGTLALGAVDDGALLSSSGAGTRMFWYPRKAAFRSGYVDADQWDDVNIGYRSYSAGKNGIASGNSSISMGLDNSAVGESSISIGNQVSSMHSSSISIGTNNAAGSWGAISLGKETKVEEISVVAFNAITLGYQTVANGNSAIAMGVLSRARYMRSIAIGISTSVGHNETVSIGNATQALGARSIAMGNGAEAIGHDSIAMGTDAIANTQESMAIGTQAETEGWSRAFAMGNNVVSESVAIGTSVVANQLYSIALGYQTVTPSSYSTVLGQYNRLTDNASDHLIVIGNGTDDANRSNAFVLLKNGNVGIKVSDPVSRLKVAGLPEYADNAAALSAGLRAGAFYKTGDQLKVVY